MYSRVKILGHPVHPMLVGFPVALYTSTFVALVIHAATQDRFWFRVAVVVNVADVIMVVPTALLGLIDLTGIPRATPAKATGLVHMSLAVSATVLLTIAMVVDLAAWNQRQPGDLAGLILSFLGVGFTVAAGFFGWSLVQTHHVGVRMSRAQRSLESTRYIGRDRAA